MTARLLLLGGLFSLVAGVLSGLARAGGPLPEHVYTHALAHGPLMICGVLGLLIGLERAVALEKFWAFGAPALALAGTGAALTPGGLPVAAWIYVVSAAWLLAVSLTLSRRGPGLAANVMALGVAAWLAGAGNWALGQSMNASAVLWICFPVLLVSGERVELAARFRMGRLGAALFLLPAASLVLGAVLYARMSALGDDGQYLILPSMLNLAVGLCGLALWLFRYDILFSQIHSPGQPRFMALCLLGGYIWLFLAGILVMASFNYDAVLHAVFLGFVFSMIFAHAPIIFPALVGKAMRFSRLFYIHAVLLHVSLIVRFAGDLGSSFEMRRLGAWLGAGALAVFLGNNAQGIIRARKDSS